MPRAMSTLLSSTDQQACAAACWRRRASMRAPVCALQARTGLVGQGPALPEDRLGKADQPPPRGHAP
eukprot:7934489-Alexandrium_andersonii.AAC.1